MGVLRGDIIVSIEVMKRFAKSWFYVFVVFYMV